MTIEDIFKIWPAVGAMLAGFTWFYNELRIRDKTLSLLQENNHKELMEMQKQNLIGQHEMTTTVANNTVVMNRILTVVERLEDKK
jgi:hypothetical protein